MAGTPDCPLRFRPGCGDVRGLWRRLLRWLSGFKIPAGADQPEEDDPQSPGRSVLRRLKNRGLPERGFAEKRFGERRFPEKPFAPTIALAGLSKDEVRACSVFSVAGRTCTGAHSFTHSFCEASWLRRTPDEPKLATDENLAASSSTFAAPRSKFGETCERKSGPMRLKHI